MPCQYTHDGKIKGRKIHFPSAQEITSQLITSLIRIKSMKMRVSASTYRLRVQKVIKKNPEARPPILV